MLDPQQTLNCNGDLVLLTQPIVMGILNITPDSFYSGSRFMNDKALLSNVEQMIDEGPANLDIGGMSSRPGAKIISVEEELERVVPVIKSIKHSFPNAVLSIDTVHSKVVAACADLGIGMVNDISAGQIDEAMYETVSKYPIPYVLMHMTGIPENMQENVDNKDIKHDVLRFFIKEIEKLRNLRVKDILLDVGFGFGKTLDDNYELLKNLHAFQILDLPVLVGISRKSMIYKFLETTPSDALIGTTALHWKALDEGAKILRVHDVKAAVQTVKLWGRVNSKIEKKS